MRFIASCAVTALVFVGVAAIMSPSHADTPHTEYNVIRTGAPITDAYLHSYTGGMTVERVRLFAEDDSRQEMINWGAGPRQGDPIDPKTVKAEGGVIGIFTAVEPADINLYRAKLPDYLAMPASPAVAFVVVFYDRRNPVTNYYEGMVMLKGECENGDETWAVMSMPVESRLMLDMGRAWGFRKYIADKMSLTKKQGLVIAEGEVRMQLDFAPRPWTDQDRAAAPKSQAWGINDMAVEHPTSKGLVPMRFAYGPLAIQERIEGEVKITIHPDDWWAKLVPPGASPGVWQRYVGAGDSVIRKIDRDRNTK